MRIRELTTQAEVALLRPMVLEYFHIVCGDLKTHFDIDMVPEEPTDNMMAKLDQFVAPLGRAYVAENEGEVVGMISLKPLTDEAYEIKRLYLTDAARGLGLGKRLIRHATEAARDLGVRELYLDTIPSLKAAIALYEADGYVHIPPYEGSEVAGYDHIRPHGVYMKKTLTP